MNGVKENKGIRQYVVPALAATAIMVLVLLTIPMTGIPAKVMGGYGSIGPVGYSVADTIVIGSPGQITVTLSGPDASNVDFSSLTFAGAPVVSWSIDTNGNVVLVFNISQLNLSPGDTTAMISGKLKDGTPFSGAVPVTVVFQ